MPSCFGVGYNMGFIQGYIGIMEKKMKTTSLGPRVYGLVAVSYNQPVVTIVRRRSETRP